MGQAASSGTEAKALPTANDVRALLFGGKDKALQRQRTLITPTTQTSDLIFEGTIQQLQGELALTYKSRRGLRRDRHVEDEQLAMDDDAEELLIVAAPALGDAKMTVLTDELCAPASTSSTTTCASTSSP